MYSRDIVNVNDEAQQTCRRIGEGFTSPFSRGKTP
jgi:hypothetical protein